MRRGELIFNCALVLAPLLLAATVAVVTSGGLQAPPLIFWSMLLLFAIGFSLLLISKLSVRRTRSLLFSFGPAQMNRRNRFLYFAGYGVMALGLLILVGHAIAASLVD